MTTAEQPSSDRLRRTTYFTGWVQGVGFRYTTRHLAADCDVAGFVRNLPDGRVELVVEGTPAELDSLQAAIEHTLGGNIREMQAADSPATGEFSCFRIAF